MKRTLRVGSQADFLPFTQLVKSQASGLLVEQLTTVLAELDLAARWQTCAPARMESELQHGTVELYCGVALTPERASRLRLSPGLVQTGAAWFTRTGVGPPGHDTVARIVTPTHGPLREIVLRMFPSLESVPVPDYQSALSRVIEGAADAAALNWHAGCEHLRQHGLWHLVSVTPPFHELSLGLAYSHQLPESLTREIDAAIAALRERGILAEIETRYKSRAAVG